jgi:hypothetical protein
MSDVYYHGSSIIKPIRWATANSRRKASGKYQN